MDLSAEIAAYDGRHTDPLESLAARLAPEPAVVRELCALAGQDEAKLQSGATWILKRFQAQGLTYDAAQVPDLLALLSRVTNWEAKLHLLQILPGLTPPEDLTAALWTLLTGPGYLDHDNKFVRAWSCNGLAQVATQRSDLRAEARRLLATAAEDEAASVRARIRNILKTTDWARA